MRRALRNTGASTMRPWKMKAPSASPSGIACNSALAHAEFGRRRRERRVNDRRSAADGSRSCSRSRARERCAFPSLRSSGRFRSICGTSHACSPAAFAALTSRPRACSKPVPAELRAEFGREIGTAEHQRGELAAGVRDRRGVFDCRAASRSARSAARNERRPRHAAPEGPQRLRPWAPAASRAARPDSASASTSRRPSSGAHAVDAQRDRRPVRRRVAAQPAEHLFARLTACAPDAPRPRGRCTPGRLRRSWPSESVQPSRRRRTASSGAQFAMGLTACGYRLSSQNVRTL